MKKYVLHITAITAVIILGGSIISHIRSQVKYADVPCPVCNSTEVLDYGRNKQGDQRAHCCNCSTDFTISDITIYDNNPICR